MLNYVCVSHIILWLLFHGTINFNFILTHLKLFINSYCKKIYVYMYLTFTAAINLQT